MQRERLGSRLGFILLSAGCAIGVGNVWKFPYMVGQYGGGAFVLLYLFFLLVLYRISGQLDFDDVLYHRLRLDAALLLRHRHR